MDAASEALAAPDPQRGREEVSALLAEVAALRDRAARLQRVTAALSEALTRDQALAAVVDHGRDAVGAFDGSVWLVDDEGRWLRAAHAAPHALGSILRRPPIPLDLPPGEVAIVDALRTGEPLWIASRRELVARYPRVAEVDEYRSLPDYGVACVPMKVGGRSVGALVLSFAAGRALDGADRAFLVLLGRHAAQALERARLFEAERRARAAAEAEQARSAFLSEASAVLASSLDWEATLARVAQLAVSRIADWCAIDLADAFWRGEPSAIVAHRDPARAERARELQRRLPVDREARGWVPEVLRTGRPEIHPTFTDEMLAAGAVDPARLAAARELEIRSAMIVPMRVRDRILGAITFVSRTPGRHGPADLEMAQHLARRSGIAVENARLYREAQEAIRARDEVLAFVSHDLKNPLSAILMSAGLLQRLPGDPRHARHAATIRRSAERMDRLIRDLLDLSAADGGRLRLARAPCDVAALLSEAVALAQPLAAGRGVRLEAAPDPAAPPAFADRDRLLQVLSNLVGNAIAFTPAGGAVTVASAAREGGVEVSVSDTGPGVPPEDRSRVFERFWTSRGSRDGSGLGLAIARTLVEAHGGRIWLDASAGPGATFRFLVPDRAPAVSGSAASPAA